MEFDDSSFPCADLVSVARTVLAEIPSDARERIQRACRRLVFLEDGDAEAEYCRDDREIRVIVRRVRDFSIPGQRGIFAHEFGHAYDVALRSAKAGDIAETMADMHAQLWRFYHDLHARKCDAARLGQTEKGSNGSGVDL